MYPVHLVSRSYLLGYGISFVWVVTDFGPASPVKSKFPKYTPGPEKKTNKKKY